MEPFIYVSTLGIKEGSMQDFIKGFDAVAQRAGAEEPRLIGIGLYVDEEANEASIVQIHPDADSMVFHMDVMDKHIMQAVGDWVVSASAQIFGIPNDTVLERIRAYGTQTTVKTPAGGLYRIPEPEPAS
jgi:hypothetical protein